MLLALTILCFLCALAYILNSFRRPPNYPPGPHWTPFVGNLPRIKKLSIELGGQHHAFAKLAKEHNTLVLGTKLGPELFVIVHSYRLVKEVLTTEVFEGRPDNFFIRLRSFGKRIGVTCTDGPFWSEHRSFLMKHMRNLGYGKKSMEIQIKAETEEILSILERDGSNVELSSVFSVSVINVIWAITTGSRFSRDDAELTRFLNLLYRRSKAFDMSGGVLSQFPWLRFIIPEKSGYNIIQQLNNELIDFFKENIKAHFKTWYPGRQDDLMYTYITQMKAEGEDTTFTEDQLIMVCIDLFIAGSTTTSSALDFLFLVMILYPKIQKKCVEHMESILNPNEAITYADRMKLPYIEAVILETQRYFTIVPVSGPRRVLKETKMEGYTIPKNTTVLISIESIHKDVEYWGDPYVFRPERFLDEEGNLIPGGGDRVVTFGLGRRRCLGELIARQSIFMFFTSIIQKFEVSVIPGAKVPSEVPIPGITLSPQKYNVQITPRKPV